MGETIVQVVGGFLLTTFIGGLLGYYFQNRTWKHQHDVELLEAERQTATQVFADVSTLMDKRLYRMRQVCWKLNADDELVERHMDRYREVLYEWNDNLNRNSALVESYFGRQIRVRLEGTVYEGFKRIGRILENHYAARPVIADSASLRSVEKDLDNLAGSIYVLNVKMIHLIQAGKVGVWGEGAGHPTHQGVSQGEGVHDEQIMGDQSHRGSDLPPWGRHLQRLAGYMRDLDLRRRLGHGRDRGTGDMSVGQRDDPRGGVATDNHRRKL